MSANPEDAGNFFGDKQNIITYIRISHFLKAASFYCMTLKLVIITLIICFYETADSYNMILQISSNRNILINRYYKKNMDTSKKPYEDLTMKELDLKSIRESKYLTLKDIFERTRISVTNLEAIENGNFHELPPPVFTKSFIKIYAKTLGVDGSSILARYEQYLEAHNTACRDVESKNIPEPARVHYKVFLWGTLILAIVGLVAFSLSSNKPDIDILKNTIREPGQKTVNVNPADNSKSDVKSEAADQTNLAIKPQERDAQLAPVPPVQPTDKAEDKRNIQHEQDSASASENIKRERKEIAESYQITMEAKELTWLRITADQNPPYQILMKPGEKIQKSASRFVIDVGNAGGIDIEFQGKSLGNLGERGQVVHLKLP